MAQVAVNSVIATWDQVHALPAGSVLVSPVAYYMVVPTGVVVYSLVGRGSPNFYNYHNTLGTPLAQAAKVTHIG